MWYLEFGMSGVSVQFYLFLYVTLSLPLQEEHRLTVFKDGILSKIFAPKTEKKECWKFHNEVSVIYTLHHILVIILWSVLRQVRSFFQSVLSTECELVLPLNLQYPLFSLRSYNSCLRLLPRLIVMSLLPSIFAAVTCFRRQFLRNIWPVQVAFLSCCM
jgi:hypothetical protein